MNLNNAGSPPKADSTLNKSLNDVVGNKLDKVTSNSIYALLHSLEEHAHSPSKVYPTLADGVALTAGASWVLGAFVEVVPVNTITVAYGIHYISIEALNTNDEYEIVLYQGASDVEVGRVRVTKNAVMDGTMNIPVQTSIIPANARIRAKCASDAGGSIATITLFYHEYP